MMKYLFLILSLYVFSACSPKSTPLYLTPVYIKEEIQAQEADYEDPIVDILFVVDSSGSMGSHQTNLIQNIDLFTNVFLLNSKIDYHIGVLTTDMCDDFSPSKYCGGELVSEGKLTFVTRKTQNSSSILKQNLKVGTSGSGTEKVFDPVYTALSKKLNTTNTGFYRKEATLVTIFVTDAEDQSNQVNAENLRDFLIKLKNGDASKIISLGVIVPSADQTCPRDAGIGPRDIERFLSFFPLYTQTNILNLCSKTYGAELSKMASSIIRQAAKVIYLRQRPILGTLLVKYGQAELPLDYKKGWSYDTYKNAVILGDDIDWKSQPLGSLIKVYFEPVKN